MIVASFGFKCIPLNITKALKTRCLSLDKHYFTHNILLFNLINTFKSLDNHLFTRNIPQVNFPNESDVLKMGCTLLRWEHG